MFTKNGNEQKDVDSVVRSNQSSFRAAHIRRNSMVSKANKENIPKSE